MSRGADPLSLLPRRGSFSRSGGKQSKTSPLRGRWHRAAMTERVQPAENQQHFSAARLFSQETSAADAVFLHDPTRENAMPGGPQTARHCSIISNFSAEYAQSTTTTTAASGGNREELLGQRPARRKCRPRHDADAGCRNPIAEAIFNRPIPSGAFLYHPQRKAPPLCTPHKNRRKTLAALRECP